METEEWHGDVLCSSIAVHSFINYSTAGALWGLCYAPYEASKQGLTGKSQASHVARSVGRNSLQCGILAGVFSASRCGIQKYREKNDPVNALIAGAVAGSVIAARTRSWKQIIQTAGLVSVFAVAADYTKSI